MVIMEEQRFEKNQWVDDLGEEDERMTGSLAVVVVVLALILAFLINLQINTTVTLNEALSNFQFACSQQGGQYLVSEALTDSQSDNPADELLGERIQHVHVCRVDGETVSTFVG